MEYLLVYCAVMWVISAWSMWKVTAEDKQENDPNWFLPTDLRVAVSIGSAVLVVLTAPLWFPFAFIMATIRGERK
jgi:hypothetical protein